MQRDQRLSENFMQMRAIPSGTKFRLSSVRFYYARMSTTAVHVATVCSPIFTALWHRGARILRNFDLLTLARAARTVKMHWLPGARMAPPGARAQGAVAGDILWPRRARARVSRSKFREIRAPQCQSAVKMGGRTVDLAYPPVGTFIHIWELPVQCSYSCSYGSLLFIATR